MVQKVVKVVNPTGFHIKPAGMFCQEAMKYQCQITFEKGENVLANAKSVLSVLGARVMMGDQIKIICQGEDEEKALEAMAALVESGFGE